MPATRKGRPRRRRHFGSIRQLNSGRYQASYPDAAGQRVVAPMTFASYDDADTWLSGIKTDQTRGVLRQPSGKNRLFGKYAADWLRDHPTQKITTRNHYAYRLKAFILPTFETKLLMEIDPEMVRRWYAKIGREYGHSQQRNAYMLLHSILQTAEEDTAIPFNPCRIKGARTFKPAKKKVLLTPEEILAVAKLMAPRYFALVIIMAVTGMRHGELMGLQRRDIDLDAGTISVVRQRRFMASHGWYYDTLKSESSERVIHLAPREMEILATHLKQFVGEEPEARVFTTRTGQSIGSHNMGAMLKRHGAKIGRPDLYAHLFRHTAATQGQRLGGTVKDVSSRMGHTEDVDRLYQHTDAEQDKAIATGLSDWLHQGGDVIDINTRRKVA